MPSVDLPAVNVEAFVEQHLGAQFDQYAALPSDVLGQTDFRVGSPPLIMVNADLTGSAIDDDESPLGLKGRWRATIAHEGLPCALPSLLIQPESPTGIVIW